MKKQLLLILFLIATSITWSQGLKTEGKKIIDQNGSEVILRGMGLGGWMLMEGYMMQSSDVADTQHEFKNRLIDLIGETKTNEFFDAWLANHVTKKDIDSLAKWGFNSIRLPMHYNLFTLPIEDEPVAGENTWLDKGFTMTDNLLDWCESNNMYLILDLHAAPGGQGANAAISDYDDSKPSLWESDENKAKTVALWKNLADRYKDEPWIGGYDLLNEVNWTLPGNTALRELYIEITSAIREVDTNHIIFIEGNSFANDFTGLTPAWDDNMVYSFHKYWSYNDQSSIQWVLDLRDQQNVPLWMGEGGENSNVWFTDAIKLFEGNDIGWSWWPMKRIETIVGPFSIKFTDGYKNILKYWRGEVSKPTVDEAYTAIMELANNTNSSNCDYQKDVPDAMIRQVATDATIPYSNHTIPGVVYMSDFDLGRNGIAYFDQDFANYSLSTGSFQAWNDGWVYRNDAIDIQTSTDNVNSNGYHIGFVKKGEWMNYTVNISESAVYKADVRLAAQSSGGQFHLSIDGEEVTTTQTVNSTGGWEAFDTFIVNDILLEQGSHVLTFSFDSAGEFNLSSIDFIKTGETSESSFKVLNGHTATNQTVEVVVNQPILASSVTNSKDNFTLLINGVSETITSITTDVNKTRSLIITTDKTIIYTDEIKVSYNGTAIESQTGNTLATFTDLVIQNNLSELFILPGKIEVEDYVEMFGLGVEETTDVGGGYNIGYTHAGDYADYIVYSNTDSNYKVDFRFAGFSVGELGLYLVDDSLNETELLRINTPITGGWQTWETVSGELSMPKGIQRLRLKIISGEFNTNWMDFELVASNDDIDGDGVLNDVDDCPNTEPGTVVDTNGCEIFTLPFDNFEIIATSETCPDRNNGKISIAASEDYNYKIVYNGTEYNLTNNATVTFNNLEPDTYGFCIIIPGENYEQCFTIVLEPSNPITGKSTISKDKASIEILKGTPPYEILLNGEILFKTIATSFDLAVNPGDIIDVKSSIECEGVYTKTIDPFNTVVAYPNPTNGKFKVVIPDVKKEVFIEIYNYTSQLISAKKYTIKYGKVSIDLSDKPKGLYIAKIYLDKPVNVKIIKN